MYSLAVQTPQRGLSPEDVVLYVMMIGYIVEGLVSARKIGLVSSANIRRCPPQIVLMTFHRAATECDVVDFSKRPDLYFDDDRFGVSIYVCKHHPGPS